MFYYFVFIIKTTVIISLIECVAKYYPVIITHVKFAKTPFLTFVSVAHTASSLVQMWVIHTCQPNA